MGRLKDIALEKGLLLFLRSKLERYGEIQEIRLDTSARTISAIVQLRGESNPISISDAKYRLDHRSDQAWIVLESANVSREWIQNLIEDHLVGMQIKIPPLVAKLIN